MTTEKTPEQYEMQIKILTTAFNSSQNDVKKLDEALKKSRELRIECQKQLMLTADALKKSQVEAATGCVELFNKPFTLEDAKKMISDEKKRVSLEKKRLRNKKNYEKNKEKIKKANKGRSKAYYHANVKGTEKKKEDDAAYRKKNKEKINKQARDRRAKKKKEMAELIMKAKSYDELLKAADE